MPPREAQPPETRRKPDAQRAAEREADRIAQWRVALTSDRLPTSWPAEAGGVPDTGACGCCGGRNYSLRRVGLHDRGGWVCDCCHPAPARAVAAP